MATPPTFVSSTETAYLTTTTPKTTASIAVTAGDVVVCSAIKASVASGALSTPTNTGTALTWTLRQSSLVSGWSPVYTWTASAVTTESITVSVDETGTPNEFGHTVTVWRNSGGVGASALIRTLTDGTPSLDVTTTGNASALVVSNGDWQALDGASRAYTTPSGATAAVERTYYRDVDWYGAYVWTHADTGAAGVKTVGMSTPTPQRYSVIALEILSAPPPPSSVFQRHVIVRASYW